MTGALREAADWDSETKGYPLRLGRNIYFAKIESTAHKPVLYLTSLAVAEQNLKAGMTYNLRLKSIQTGRVFMIPVTLRESVDKHGLATWPLYGFLPEGCDTEIGHGLYVRLEPLDMIKWFETDEEKTPEQMWRF